MSTPTTQQERAAAGLPRGGFAVIAHEDCEKHDVGRGHPEQPARVRVILEALRAEISAAPLPAPIASREQLLLFHTAAHVDNVLRLCERAEAAAAAGGRRKKGKGRNKGRGTVVAVDEDTAVMQHSRLAALRAVGACCRAVDLVCGAAGGARAAFCAVRPPGHHAEPARACGFCLFNNVGVAALHAQRAHGIGRVAVVDFDVHHGNGTEELFKDCADGSLLYLSTHQYDPQGGFYPGTGSNAERGSGAGSVLNVPLLAGDGSAAFRAAFEGTLLPALEAFRPELLLVSAGFDAHAADPLAALELSDADFAWASELLCGVARRHARGRLVSVLEGGYDLSAIARCAVAHARALRRGAAEAAEAQPSAGVVRAAGAGGGATGDADLCAAVRGMAVTDAAALEPGGGGAACSEAVEATATDEDAAGAAASPPQAPPRTVSFAAAMSTPAPTPAPAPAPAPEPAPAPAPARCRLRLEVAHSAGGKRSVPLVLEPHELTVPALLQKAAQKLKIKTKRRQKGGRGASSTPGGEAQLAAVARKGGQRIAEAGALRALTNGAIVDIVLL
eukprot:g2825.t1